MRRISSSRAERPYATRRRVRGRAQPVALFAIVDSERIPARCFGDPLCFAASDRDCEKAYEALCESLCRNRQVGLATVAVDGEPCVAALLPIGNMLAVSPLRPEYTAALTDGLRAAG